MRVFNIKRFFIHPSGLDFAQKHRMDILDELSVDNYLLLPTYLFINPVECLGLQGIASQKVLYVYDYLSDRPTLPCSFSVEDFFASLADDFLIKEKTDDYLIVELQELGLIYRVWLAQNGTVTRVNTYLNNQLETTAHYDASLNNMEYFHDGKVIRRVFFYDNQEVSFMQFYEDGQITQTHIDGKVLLGQTAFYRYFFEKLELATSDLLIFDNAFDTLPLILPCVAGKARLFGVVHDGHHLKKQSEGKDIVVRSFYEYLLQNARHFEKIIVSTKSQKELLEKHLVGKSQVCRIPVGFIEEIEEEEVYVPYTILTASRLARERNIDVLIKAVAIAQKSLPKLRFDIYGMGGQKEKLQELINSLDVGDFITLKGFQKLDKTYSKYSLYLSSRTSEEAFGLSLLEAMSHSLPIIALDIEYGNKEFVIHGENGLLIEHTSLEEAVEKFAAAIVDFYQKDMGKSARYKSKEIAQGYTKEKVKRKWEQVLENKA